MSEYKMCGELMEAHRVAVELQEWIDSIDGLSTIPLVSVRWNRLATELSIGKFVVWYSQNDSSDELTLDICRNRFIDEIFELQPFLSKKDAEPS